MDGGAQSTSTREWDSVREQAARAAGDSGTRVMLVLACGHDARVIPLTDERELTIGRAEPADVLLSDPSLSRRHACVRRQGDAVAITDLGSRNGVLIGGRPVEQGVLRAGDTAVLGSVSLSVQVVASADRSSARQPQRSAVARAGGVGRDVVRASPAMLELQRVVERIAQRTIPVLLLGETGTGKEVIARELHQRSPRRDKSFVVVNCAALPDGLVESTLFGAKRGAFTGADRDRPGAFVQADGGTLFLDEVGELSSSAQAALLRALDSKRVSPVGDCHEIEVDARVVAATHRDLRALTEQGRFRLDLYHRLNALTLQLPPLRTRREEIPALAEHFLLRFALDSGSPAREIDAQAMQRLLAYDWPGNVRELRNVIERAVALADHAAIGLHDLPAELRPAPEGGAAQRNVDAALPALEQDRAAGLRAELLGYEARLIHDALQRAAGNRRDAAQLLKLPLRTFERKLSALQRARQRAPRRPPLR